MTTMQTTADLVTEALNRAERSVSWVADKAGIAPSTLRRKLRGTRDFTTGELAQIAASLGVRPSTLLPLEFRDADHAESESSAA